MTEARMLPPDPSESRSVGEASACPTSETLSAYLEGGLDGAARAQIEDHLSRCEDCYFLVRETLLTLPALDEPGQASPKGDPRRRRHLLAIAATLLVGLGSGAAWWLLWRDAHAAAVAGLVKEVGKRRFFEARLTGGFQHGPVVGVKRAARSDNSDQWGMLSRAGKIIAEANPGDVPDLKPSRETGRALAAAYLFVGEIDRALALLEPLAREHSMDARLQSDLAAACLVRAAQPPASPDRDSPNAARPDDARKALDAAAAAVRLDPSLREAQFNRALALEALQQTEEAIRAWEAYRSAFPGDDWLPAVAAHLDRLRREP